MIDIRFLRENPDAVRENIRKKFQDEKLPLVDEAIRLDAEKRAAQQECEQLKAARNKLSKANGPLYGQLKKADEAQKADIQKQIEEKIKEETKATIRCIPFESFVEGDKEPGKCMVTGKPSACRVIFARSY